MEPPNINLLACPESYEVLWDYCLEYNIIMPSGCIFCNISINYRAGSGTDRRFTSKSHGQYDGETITGGSVVTRYTYFIRERHWASMSKTHCYTSSVGGDDGASP